jgi:hypothetical protein
MVQRRGFMAGSHDQHHRAACDPHTARTALACQAGPPRAVVTPSISSCAAIARNDVPAEYRASVPENLLTTSAPRPLALIGASIHSDDPTATSLSTSTHPQAPAIHGESVRTLPESGSRDHSIADEE